jgi:hypothetical protein
METPKEYYYTYYSYEEWGRGYFGSRGCKCLPEEDVKYFGSFKDKTFKPTQKIILKSDYATREEAYADEIILQEHYKVVENPHFANRAYQTTTRFSTLGLFPSDETRKKLSRSHKGRTAWNKGMCVSDEVKEKIRQKNKGRKQTEEHKFKRTLKLAREFTLVDPYGRIVTGKNVSKFCRDNNLSIPHIFSVISGKRNHHKGWTIYKNDDF